VEVEEVLMVEGNDRDGLHRVKMVAPGSAPGPPLFSSTARIELIQSWQAFGCNGQEDRKVREAPSPGPQGRVLGGYAVGQVAIPSLSDQRESRHLPGGRAIVFVAEGGGALVDTGTFQARTLHLPHSIECHALSADGRTLAIVERREKTTVKIWRLVDETP
jgi:hypothetical protein